MLDIILDKIELLIYIYIRMLGFIVFNPVFGRRNVAAFIKNAVAIALAVFLASILDKSYVPEVNNLFAFVIIIIKEFIYGYVLGLTAHIFFSAVTIVGEIIDMQMGLGMSRMYDPGSNVQMPLAGSFYNIVLVLLFFFSGCHLALVQICFLSYNILPIGFEGLNPGIGYSLMQLFAYIFTLSIRLALPVMAAELITETGIGIIMRAVPQINVFVVGVQLKVFIGMITMLVCAAVTARFLDGMLGNMNIHIRDALLLLSEG